MRIIRIAIDPGISGGLAISDPAIEVLPKLVKCPETPFEMLEALMPLLDPRPVDGVQVVIEQVHGGVFGGAKVGAVSMFNFGKNLGQWQGVLAGLRALRRFPVQVIEVPPKSWQKHFPGLPSGPDSKAERKKEIQRRVQAYFPNVKIPLYLADAAAMLAVWGNIWPKEA